MLKKILLAAAALVAILAVVVATRPSTYRVERSGTIAAPAGVVYAQIADFHRWEGWSPWAKLDPAMKTTYQGTDGAVGASYYWTGNDKVGEGRMTIVEARPGQRLGIKLEFIRPFAAINDTSFELSSQKAADGTASLGVVWAMEGHHNFIGKAFGMFMDMDKMVGGDFEKGLSQLAASAAAEARKAAPPAAAPPAQAAAPAAAK